MNPSHYIYFITYLLNEFMELLVQALNKSMVSLKFRTKYHTDPIPRACVVEFNMQGA